MEFANDDVALHDALRSYCEAGSIPSVRARSIVVTALDCDSPLFPMFAHLNATPDEIRMLFTLGYHAGRTDAKVQLAMTKNEPELLRACKVVTNRLEAFATWIAGLREPFYGPEIDDEDKEAIATGRAAIAKAT